MTQYAANGVSVVKTGYVKPRSIARSRTAPSVTNGLRASTAFGMTESGRCRRTTPISIVAHEPVKDTGLRRTWPNMLGAKARASGIQRVGDARPIRPST